MMFNTLGVAACASIFTKKPIQIDWWPITRDSIIYSLNISILVAIAWDGFVMWWESIILVVLYVCYWILMFQNPRIMKFFKHIIEDRLMWCQRIKNYDIPNQKPKEPKPDDNQSENGNVSHPRTMNGVSNNRESYKPYEYENYGYNGSTSRISTIEPIKARDRTKSFDDNAVDPPRRRIEDRRMSTDLSIVYEEEFEEYGIWEYPHGLSKFEVAWYFFTWPIRFVLYYTIPNPLRHRKFFVVSFIMCIIWIAAVSYMVFWMVVIIGNNKTLADFLKIE